MKQWISKLVVGLSLAVFSCLLTPETTEASQGYYDEYGFYHEYENLYFDDDYDSEEENYEQTVEDNTYYGDMTEEQLSVYYGDTGTLTTPGSWIDKQGIETTITRAEFRCDDDWNEVIQLSSDGTYQITGVGEATVQAEFYDMADRCLLTKIYYVVSGLNMNGVTLNKTSATSYVRREEGAYATSQFEFRLKSTGNRLPDQSDYYDVSCESSNEKISASAYMKENQTIALDVYGSGKTTVKLTVNGQTFRVKLNIIAVGINKNSMLLSAGQSGQLKIYGMKKGIKWSSSKPSVVKVTRDGKVKALKNGNAVIKAKVGDFTMGCAVSVTTSERCKTIRQAVKIGKTCTYSQPQRMQKGFYDCSSLTWTAYKSSGISFGNSYYAPVAAAQAQWCVEKGKEVKGGLSEANIQKMKLRAGDLMFEEGADNGRYRGIYHVEMIRGYVCQGFDEKGKAILGIAWANRFDNYYWPAGQLVCHP